MTYFKDLTRYAYFTDDSGILLNVGWIDGSHELPKGRTSPEFIEKLAWACVYSPVKRTPGIHKCPLCPPMNFGYHMVNLGQEKHLLGSSEIRVKGFEAEYAAPDLVLHYVEAHEYLPPDDFIAGVLMLEAKLPRDHWTISRGPHWRTN